MASHGTSSQISGEDPATLILYSGGLSWLTIFKLLISALFTISFLLQGHTEAAIENQVEEGKKLQAMQRNKLLQLITETSNILTNRPAQELYQHAIRLVQGLWDDPKLQNYRA